MQFSIIVPVYNVENYIRECLNSILNQSFTDYELILIDDGSTDLSGIICDEYAATDSRIRVFHKTNGGLSSARNVGISEAKGEYLIFIDSDDWIKEESLLGIYNSILKYNYPDVIETTMTNSFPDNSIEQHDENFSEYIQKNGFGYQQAQSWMSRITQDKWCAPKKILKKSFLISENLKFTVGRLHEDIVWIPYVCYYAKSFGCYDKPWYFYRKNREDSITSSVNFLNIISLIDNSKEILELYNKTNNSYVFNFLLESIKYLYYSLYKNKFDFKSIKIISKKIKDNKDIFKFKYAQKMTHKIFLLSMIFLGPKISILFLSSKIFEYLKME